MQYISFVPTFFLWWYGRGLADLFSFVLALFTYIKNMFSVTTLIQTLFSPWKKMAGARRPGIDGLKDWLIDNLISRGVGFVVRVFMLLFSLLAMILAVIFSIIIAVLWVGMPALVVGSFLFIFLGY